MKSVIRAEAFSSHHETLKSHNLTREIIFIFIEKLCFYKF